MTALLETFQTLALEQRDIRLSIVCLPQIAIPSLMRRPRHRRIPVLTGPVGGLWENAEGLAYASHHTGFGPTELCIVTEDSTDGIASFVAHFGMHDSHPLTRHLRALELRLTFGLPKSRNAGREANPPNMLLSKAPSLQRLNLHLRAITEIQLSYEELERGLLRRLRSLTASVVLPHLSTLELPKDMWHMEPLVDFICRHSSTLTLLHLVDVEPGSFNVSADGIQQASTKLKNRFPSGTLSVRYQNVTLVVGPDFDPNQLEIGEEQIKWLHLNFLDMRQRMSRSWS